MAKYTITIKTLIDNNFDFKMNNYPIFDENYRETLNNNILNHYYENEIGFETASLFRFYLNQKLNEIMPYYNELQKPTLASLELFAYRLYDTERITDTNLNAQRTPILIEGDTKTILTLKNVYMQYSGNTPFIFGNKQFDISNKLNVLKTDAPYIIDKLDVHKHQIFNDALTVLGIDNANTDKKERLITNEVESNEQLITYYLNCYYKTRKKACDEINEKFLKDNDTKIEIVLNKDVMDLLNKTENDIINYEDRSDDDGEIYNYY